MPLDYSPRGLKKLFDRLHTDSATAYVVGQELANYMRPTRTNLITQRQPGAKQTTFLFDGTALQESDNLAAALSGTFTSDAFPWFSLVMQDSALNDDLEVRKWLWEVEKRITRSLQQSNFSAEMHEVYLDLVVFGTACLYQDEIAPNGRDGFRGFHFKSVPYGQFEFLEGPLGLADTVLRKFPLPVSEAATFFGGAEKLSEKSRTLLQTQPEKPIDIVHAVWPTGYEQAGLSFPRGFASRYIEYADEHELRSRFYYDNPYAIPRWLKTSGERLGRGPGHNALPDTRSLNEAVNMRFKSWAKAIDPPMWELDDSVIGRISLQAGSRTVVRSKDAIGPIETAAKFEPAMAGEQVLQDKIGKFFYADRLKIPGKLYMTAYEVQEQIETMQRHLGPTVGRLKPELLRRVVDRSFSIMFRAGALPPLPPVLEAAVAEGRGNINVEYESPLTRKQRTGDLVAVERTLQVMAPIIPLRPEVLDNYDLDEIARHVGDTSGMPAKLLMDAREVLRLRNARAEGMREKNETEQGVDQAKTLKDVASAAVAAKEAMAPSGPTNPVVGPPRR